MVEEKVIVKISKDLYNVLVEKVSLSEGEFKTVGDYVDFILREVLEDSEVIYSAEDEEIIKERLKKLGYI